MFDMSRPDTATRDSLLDAAERLFAERGFALASVRAITEEAGTNVASVNYHFGSKLELTKAVLERRFGPLNAERLRRLAACEAMDHASLEDVVAAFVEPAVEWIRTHEDRAPISRLLGMAFSQPSPELQALMLEQFAPVVDRFATALARLLPGIDRRQLYWRVHFMIGTLAFTVALGPMVESYSRGLCDPSDADGICRELVGFISAGFQAETIRPEAS